MTTHVLRIVFAGTPDFAAAHLNTLLQSEHEVVAVYTQPDRPAGRGRKLQASPVKVLALEHGIEVFQPEKLNTAEHQHTLAGLNADIMVVVAYGIILPIAILKTPRLGCINVHASILPRWRGAAPIHRALLAGDTKTGVTIMQMDAGLDTGNMLVKAECSILPLDDSQQLHDRLIEVGAPVLLDALQGLAKQTLEGEVQDDALACYAKKLSKEEGLIDWNKPVVNVLRQIQGLYPWPVAYSLIDNQPVRVFEASVSARLAGSKLPGQVVSVGKDHLSVACSQGVLDILTLQMPGAKRLAVGQVMNAKLEMFQSLESLG